MNVMRHNGLEFLDFIQTTEEELYKYEPLAGSFAVIKCTDKYLMCYNVWRKQWELPAGRREENETPKECALRELYEETGQRILDLEFKGLLKSKRTINGEIKLNPVYFGKTEEIQLFKENEEISKIKLWDLREEIGYIDSVDIRILDYM